MRTLQLSTIDNSKTITLRTPQYNYEVTIDMSLLSVETESGDVQVFDNGVEFDYRTVNFEWLLSRDEQLLLNDFINSIRQDEFDIKLGSSSTGFYPFGSDLGDKNTFRCKLIDIETSGVLREPWLYFNNDVTLRLVSAPDYDLPVVKRDGKWQIGNVTGIRQPQAEVNHVLNRNRSVTSTRSGKVSVVDMGKNSDTYKSDFDLILNSGLCAELVQFLTGTQGRGSDIIILVPSNTYLFGSKSNANGSGTYICKNLTHTIKLKHVKFNRWETELSFMMRTKL